ncbi:MAG TPA: class I lanthipeptide [Kofleriaceae bacterium]|jgi:hypothetical protein|nr:class I lanthipeptide [Kofleriaceae bacterium]
MRKNIKKLSLDRQTVRRLSGDALDGVVGGATNPNLTRLCKTIVTCEQTCGCPPATK